MIEIKKGDRLVPLIRAKLMDVIGSSLSTPMFQRSFFLHNGKMVDICENGKFSCVFFVSFVLKPFDLIGTLHVNNSLEKDETISNFEKDLLDYGWRSSDILLFLGVIAGLRNEATEALLVKSPLSKNKNHVLRQYYPGSIIIWKAQEATDGLLHRHVGFYLYNQYCVSTTQKEGEFAGFLELNHVTYWKMREIEKVYTHPQLTHERLLLT